MNIKKIKRNSTISEQADSRKTELTLSESEQIAGGFYPWIIDLLGGLVHIGIGEDRVVNYYV